MLSVANQEGSRPIIKGWLDQRMEDVDSFQLPEIAEEGAEVFAKDEDFRETYLKPMLRDYIYNIAKDMVHQTRDDPFVPISDGEGGERRSSFERRAQSLALKFAGWMEHAGDKGHLKLMKMTKEEVITASNERWARVKTEIDIIHFERAVADRLEPGEIVENRFTPEDLAELWTEIVGEE